MRAHRIYGPSPEPAEPLQPVSDLRDTPVDDAGGHYAGRLHGALAEADTGLIRYLDLSVEGDRRHVLVPLGHARLERDWRGHPRMRLLAATREQLRRIPVFHADTQPVDQAYGRTVARAHGRLFQGERYYAHPAFDHSGLYAGEHPIEPAPAVPARTGTLERLSALPGHGVASGEPDIRGWPLRARGRTVGRIEDLVVDAEAGKVRYAVVKLDDADRSVLVPVGYLRVRRRTDTVEAPSLQPDDLLALPRLDPGPVTRAVERGVRRTLARRLDGDGRHFDRPDYGPAGHPVRG